MMMNCREKVLWTKGKYSNSGSLYTKGFKIYAEIIHSTVHRDIMDHVNGRTDHLRQTSAYNRQIKHGHKMEQHGYRGLTTTLPESKLNRRYISSSRTF
jgi:hypothetical protein